ncbi:unnamed protein product [Cuscuta epithymum]|nr:unnamed protein product [Cuscuta epithymum]CAH9138993.1 unnamed protein product [Cuscuta epithymum]
MTGMFRYWPKLTEAHLHVFFVRKIVHCKEITKLQLYGWIRDNNADMIANKLPQLEHLDIQSCVLSSRALAIILDGQRELKHLDTRHAARFDDKFLSVFGGNPFGKAIDWNEEEIFPKVAHIKTYLECQRKCCPVCANFYDASVSKLGLRAWLFYDLSNHPHERGWCISNKCIAGRYPYTVPTVSCIVHEFGSILPSDFRPVQDDSRVLSINRDF